MQTFIHQKARRGVTLIEAVLFISIALGLIVGGLVFFQQAALAARTNDAIRSISGLASEVRAAYRTAPNFNGLDDSVLINAGAVPSSQINADGDGFTNEWGQVATVGPNVGGTPEGSNDDQFFEIEYENIPVAACTRLSSATAGNGPIGPGIVAIRATGAGDDDETVYAKDGDDDIVSLTGTANITPAAAAAMCNQTAPVDVVFTLTR